MLFFLIRLLQHNHQQLKEAKSELAKCTDMRSNTILIDK